ncbi:unnamed protein product [Caenorhabditis angaria]|uniref:Uncharacterized protein n=1 Tax=Caenorhabditis angaria TaxID=860376 RepID=A0A9P1NAM7_9PELO|nr:unnamed protein product [Caenorhabditis angaria]
MSNWLKHLVFFIFFCVVTASALPSDYVRFLIQSARENSDHINDIDSNERFMRVNRDQMDAVPLNNEFLLNNAFFRYG